METPDFEKIAAQLRQPSGSDGMETADRMEENNAGMIRACIDRLAPETGNSILELGFGGGGHLPYLLQKTTGLQYEGVDISESMTARAATANAAAVQQGQARFRTVASGNGYVTLPFEDASFDRIFSVNTLYFWDNAPAQAAELYRVLRPSGKLTLAFADEAFMKTLPFTQYGFHLYTADKAVQLMQHAGFIITELAEERETVMSNAGPLMERSFLLLSVSR